MFVLDLMWRAVKPELLQLFIMRHRAPQNFESYLVYSCGRVRASMCPVVCT